MKESNEVCQVKELTNRKLRRQKIIIDAQTTEIQRLTKENERVNEINKSQKVTIQRLEAELSLFNNKQANEVHDKHSDIKKSLQNHQSSGNCAMIFRTKSKVESKKSHRMNRYLFPRR